MSQYLPSFYEMLTILAMGTTTYFTRIIGFIWLRKHTLSARARAVLESSPCCVMISVVAPSFMTTDPKMLIALFATVLIAFRLSLGLTIVVSVIMMGLLQNFA